MQEEKSKAKTRFYKERYMSDKEGKTVTAGENRKTKSVTVGGNKKTGTVKAKNGRGIQGKDRTDTTSTAVSNKKKRPVTNGELKPMQSRDRKEKIHGKQGDSAALPGNRKMQVNPVRKVNPERNVNPIRNENTVRSENPIRKVKTASDACPYIKQCGGCQILQQSYENHLKKKQRQVDTLIGKYCRVEKIIGMQTPLYYRNKVHVVFDHDQKGNPVSGVYEEKTHRVVPIKSCYIHNQKADAIINSIRGMLKSFKIKTYDEDTGYGLLRHVMIRTGLASGQIMVVLVISSPILPSKNNFVKALLNLHPEISTIILNVNDKRTSMVLGEKEQVIYGKGYIEDRLCERVFRISPKSFYQVNPVQTEVLYHRAVEFAALTGKETVIDAYCGIGTISLILSDCVKRVIGVELNKDAVRDAHVNAKQNQIKNIDFYNKDAGEFMSQLALAKETVDVVFMDPPRVGSDEMFLKSLVALHPGKVVYISCNPETLERDLRFLTGKGYQVQRGVPVDMFPWTEHVETVCLLSRKG